MRLSRSTCSNLRSRLVVAGVGFVVLVFLCMPAWSADEEPETAEQTPVFSAGPLSMLTSAESGTSNKPMPLVLNATGDGFDFDLGGSETRKLHLYLDSPLTLEAMSLGVETETLSFPGRNALGLDATLNLPVSPALSFTGEVQRSREQARFQPVGSIKCTDGILRPYSYTASGCRFIDDSFTGIDRGSLSLGARYRTPSTSTSISWFTQTSEQSGTGTSGFNAIEPASTLGADLLTPVMTNPLLPGLPAREPMSYFDGQASGVDLNFQVGVTTGSQGDLHFGLGLTRVLDANFSGMYSSLTPWGWTISDSFDTARMNVEWNRGAFSTGIQGFYREQVDFLNRNSLDSVTTFDVHFTWRTPWNADLSVGASNILNAGADDSGASDGQPSDPFESIYGRIPYVRYKQDL